MKGLTKKKLGFGIGSFLLVMFIGWILADNHFAVAGNSSTVSVEYQVHVQSEGWKGYVSNGTTGGTTGKSRAIEAIKIKIKGMSGGIRYQTHLQKIGWTDDWEADNQQSGTTGQTRAIEAIRIELTGAVAKTHDVYYKVHVGEYGWLDWTKNGGIAGSTDCNMRMEAIQIKICPKNKKMSTAKAFITKPVLTTQAHVGKVGWQKAVSENSVSGTVEKGLRMEAMKIQCSDFSGGNGIQYRSHIQNTGWENNWRKSGETSGTTGRSLQMEAVQIKLTGQISKVFDVYYRVHVSDFGWLGWTKNGEAAGTTGGSKQMEAIQVRLMHKGDNSIKIGGAYIDLSKSMSGAMFDKQLGKTLANISSCYYTSKNILYVGGYKGQCTWYAFGRFYEVNNVKLKKARNAKYWLSDNKEDNRVSVLYDASKIKPKSIAVRTAGTYGHVIFIEEVTYKNGSPQYVYFTECNADGNGHYDVGKDCILKKLSYQKFINQKNPAGYIVAK